MRNIEEVVGQIIRLIPADFTRYSEGGDQKVILFKEELESVLSVSLAPELEVKRWEAVDSLLGRAGVFTPLWKRQIAALFLDEK